MKRIDEKRPNQSSNISPTSDFNSSSYSNSNSEARQDAIRRRAYELFEQRGYREGGDLEDWLQAEQEFSQKQRAA
ncbi:MAG: DUF2934 domain-containing protein [Terriglobales bacterium]